MIKKIINLLKSNKKEIINTNNMKNNVYINGKQYFLEITDKILVQEPNPEKKIYGWSLEFRCKYNDKWNNWEVYWNKKIYSNRESAISAAINIKNTTFRNTGYEFRVRVLYSMDATEWRDWTIEQVLKSDTTNTTEKSEKPIRAWKLKDEYVRNPTSGYYKSTTYPKNSLFIEFEDEILMCATATNPTSRWQRTVFNEINKNSLLEEVDITKEIWYHPHLIKQIKQKLNVR